MSRAVKVPEALYGELRAEADRGGVSVMEALQRRLRSGEEELRTLRTARQALEERLGDVQAALGQAVASHETGKAEVAKLRAEVSRLGGAVAAKAERIARLEEAVAAKRAGASAVRRDRAAAERKAEEQKQILQAVALVVGAAVVGWLAWRWWKHHTAQPAAAPVPQRQPTQGIPRGDQWQWM